jgi:hypothetical protein
MPTSTRPATGRAQAVSPGRRAGSGSVWWLVAVAAAFTAVQAALVAPRLGLSWDEIVYVSQVSVHAPASIFGPPRARGISLLVAPVAELTSSVLALRIYLAIWSGAGLLAAMLVWRRLRPAWLVALAGLFFASLWVTLYYGSQAMPDLWVALSALAGAGFFLRAAGAARPAAGGPAGPGGPAAIGRVNRALAGLAGSLAVAALVRPGDAIFLAAGLVGATAVVPRWRRWPLLVATAAGVVAGAAEWVIEAYVRFGGPLRRLHGASLEQGGLAPHLGFLYQLHAVTGPTLCRPCALTVRSPALSLWWLALPVVAAAGIVAARSAGRLASSALAASCALAIGCQYLFLINYAAPRFLLPFYALLSIPVADALGWLVTGVRAGRRPVTGVALAAILAAQVISQQVVLSQQVASKVSYFGDFSRVATDLHRLGVRPPCIVNGDLEIPLAFYAGCGSATSIPAALRRGYPPGRVALLEAPTAELPAYAHGWRRVSLPGLRNHALAIVAYLPRS